MELNTKDLFAAEIMVTSYQKQYFYTETIEHALDFVRDIANNIQRPFSVRYNPYTQASTKVYQILIGYPSKQVLLTEVFSWKNILNVSNFLIIFNLKISDFS